MIDIKIHSRCPLCSFEGSVPLKSYEDAHLVKCRRCKLVYSSKIPSRNELTNHYATYNRNLTISEITFKRYEQLLGQFSTYRKTNRILDVGCGSGFFLDVAKKLNWNAYGTEFDDEAVNLCKGKGLAVFEGPIENMNLEPESFDIITSFEVIEHLSYPLAHFKALFRLLRPGGILYVTTPNFNAITRYILKNDWDIIEYPEHLTYFTTKTLNTGLESVSFKRKKIITNGISVDRLRNSFKKSKNASNKGSSISGSKNKAVLTNESIRRASESNSFFRILRKTIDFGLNTTRKGEFLKGYYIKPE